MREMRGAAPLLVALILLAGAGPAVGAETRANAWSRIGDPSDGPSRAIGGVAHGCLTGAVRLPDDGPGFEVIRLSRHRDFGHPQLIAFIERLGRRARAAGLPSFYVGDMAQPRGGPLPYGHASHQTGIDVDVWFAPATPLPRDAREEVDLPSMLRPASHQIDPRRFGRSQVRLLRLAAEDPAVERIFVNAAIKEALCRGVGGAAQGGREWLARLRPWYGHDEHFHVRLRCPADSPDCEAQAPPPPGNGCDGTLAWWRNKPPPQPSLAVMPEPTLPAACHALLSAP
jgi:penicillin-insensitive murein DD-endopeptidase